MFLALCAFIGVLQLITLFAFGEESEWKLYPLSTHLPLALFLCIVYKKRLETVLATIFTAYLFCQPVKWFGVLAYYLSHRETIDYIAIVYTDLWIDNNRVVAEFLPLMLVFIYMTVTILYSNEVEEKMYAEHKASIIRITSEQQKKEIEAIRRNEHEIKLLHHDMRLFLSTPSVCLEEEDYNKAKVMLSSYSSHIDNAGLKKYCGVDTINYILSDFEAKCTEAGTEFEHDVEPDHLTALIKKLLG